MSDLLEKCFSGIKVLDVLIETRFGFLESVFVVAEHDWVSQDVLFVFAVLFFYEAGQNLLQNTSFET